MARIPSIRRQPFRLPASRYGAAENDFLLIALPEDEVPGGIGAAPETRLRLDAGNPSAVDFTSA